MLKHVCKVKAKSIEPISREAEIIKSVPQQDQQQSGVSYRVATSRC